MFASKHAQIIEGPGNSRRPGHYFAESPGEIPFVKKNESVTHASVMTLTNWCTSLLQSVNETACLMVTISSGARKKNRHDLPRRYRRNQFWDQYRPRSREAKFECVSNNPPGWWRSVGQTVNVTSVYGPTIRFELHVRKTHTYWVKSIYFKFHASWQPCIRLQIKKNSDAGNQTDFSYSCIAMLQIKKSFAVGAQRSPAGTPRDQWARRTRHWLHSLRFLGIPGIAASPFEFWSNYAI